MIRICKELTKHAREVIAALSSFKYERDGNGGIFIPSMRATVSGMYIHNVNGLDERMDPNLVVDQGLNYLLGAGLGADAKITSWYLALFGGGVNPAANWTAANFATNASEIVSGTEGYTELTRPIFTPGAAAAAAIDNVASKAAFTINTAGTLNVTGAGMLSDNVKGSTAGKLVSATRFSAPRTLNDDDVFNLGYRVQIAAT